MSDELEKSETAIGQGYDNLQAERVQTLEDTDREFRHRHNIPREA